MKNESNNWWIASVSFCCLIIVIYVIGKWLCIEPINRILNVTYSDGILWVFFVLIVLWNINFFNSIIKSIISDKINEFALKQSKNEIIEQSKQAVLKELINKKGQNLDVLSNLLHPQETSVPQGQDYKASMGPINKKDK